jgi:hypothetical protein
MHGLLDQAVFGFLKVLWICSLIVSNRNKLELGYANRREFVTRIPGCLMKSKGRNAGRKKKKSWDLFISPFCFYSFISFFPLSSSSSCFSLCLSPLFFFPFLLVSLSP